MEKSVRKKILPFDDLIEKVKGLRADGKVVVQSHGVFDLIHPGHIKHLNTAKAHGDVLIVTVIKDKDVRRGPGRPVFPEKYRAENIASLMQVDYVSIVDDETPFECVRTLKPDFFAKGQEHKERDKKIHDKIFEAEKELFLGKCEILETEGFSFSSSSLINSLLDIYPDETRQYLKKFASKYDFKHIADLINGFKDMKVLLIGDGIVDEYHFCESMGKSAKAHLVVSKYLTHEVFNGGVFAIANHMAGFVDKVTMVSLLGREDSREDFILKNLKPNVEAKFFYRDDGPTIVKKRYINQYLNQKLFEVNYLNDRYLDEDAERGISEYLIGELPKYDLVVVSDFGHGFISDRLIRVIEDRSRMLAVNTQTNSANTGFNMITKYSKPNFICLDEPEVRLAAQERYIAIEDIASNIMKTIKAECLVITLGKRGSIAVNRKGEIARAPIFSSKVVDTVGAGDAVFSYSAPCFARGAEPDMITFIGNAVGALAVQIMGNKSSVEKHDLLEFIHGLMK